MAQNDKKNEKNISLYFKAKYRRQVYDWLYYTIHIHFQ